MRKFVAIVVLACIFTILGAASAQNADPIARDAIAALKSDAPLNAKMDACRTLALTGTPDAVPVLAALLVDEKLSHMARLALEPMPFPEACAALRDALGKTSGRLKVGVINSLAIRKDEQAVPELIKLLSGADADVVQVAAVSLGKIATPEAAKALDDAVAQPNVPAGNLAAFCDGLLGCAEKFTAKGQRDQAIAIYDRLFKLPSTPAQIHAAALRGAVLARGGEQGVPQLVEALRGNEESTFAAALRVSRELGAEPGIAAAMAGVLPTLPAERKIRLIEALGGRGGAATGPALLAEAKDGPVEVRVAALLALTRMAYSPALGLMAQLASGDDIVLAKAARDSLSYFPGKDREADIKAMLEDKSAGIRRVAVELIGGLALGSPVGILMKVAETDADESVRVAALKALKDCAGAEEMQPLLADLLKARSPAQMQATEGILSALCERQKRTTGGIVIQKAVYGKLPDGPSADVLEQVSKLVKSGSLTIEASNATLGDPAPGVVKELCVEYTENDAPVSKTVKEGETIKLTGGSAPAAVVDAFCGAFEKAQGEPKLAMLRLLGSTGSPKALEAVRAASSAADAAVKETALRTLCEWPSLDALPALMELVKTSSEPTMKVLALRGAVRLLGQGTASPAETLAQYTVLMDQARTPDEKKSVLGGLAQTPNAGAFELALAQFGDASVKAEAVQAAIAIAKNLGKSAREDTTFFNGKDLTGWQGDAKLWRFEDGALVGQSKEPVAKNEFLWSGVEVRDFYLAVDIKLEPNTGNGGVQFRSKKIDERGQARGYQGDVGQDVWGRLYHEQGRGKLDWTDCVDKAVVPGEWNHYEILAVGPAIWTAINGKLGVACLDLAGKDERSGLMALQLHAGPPQTVRYRIKKFVHDPKVELEGIPAETLINELKVPEK